MKTSKVIYLNLSRKAAFFAIFLLTSIHLFSQKIAIENQKLNVAYPFITNYLTVVAENVPCKELIITTDNGIIKGSNCEYEFIPNKIGIAKIYIKRKVKADTLVIGERLYRVKQFPKQFASIGKHKSGKISAGELKAQEGLVIIVESFEIDAKLPIKRFIMKIVRNNAVICTMANEGGRFSEAVSNELSKIKKGDKVYFEDIYAMMPGMKHEEKLNIIDLIVE